MEYKVSYISVTLHSEGQRIDNFLLKKLKGVPKSKIYTIIRKGEVRVNKKRILPSYRLEQGDYLRIPPVRMGQSAEQIKHPADLLEKLENSILFEDNHLLILNKPAGIAVHGGSGIVLGVIEAIRQLRPKAGYLELVHRLDRDTSGCLMIAKSRSQLVDLHNKLLNQTILKTYHGIVVGEWPKNLSTINQPLTKNILQSGERMVCINPVGKPSRTNFNVLKRLKGVSLLEISPKTGRTHQIRVHTAFAEHPILGDAKYGDKQANQNAKNNGYKRMFLHAHSIKFDCSRREQTFNIEAPYDEAFSRVLNGDNKR